MLSQKDLLKAIHFSAEKHRFQRRKGGQEGQDIPYVNHPIMVAHILSEEGQVDDTAILMAALLHDTIEDTDATADEIQVLFGDEVCELVKEVTDDKSLPKAVRKQQQIEHAPHMNPKAQAIKLADKTSNLRDIISAPPDWTLERKQKYFEWAKQVVDALRGSHPKLEAIFDQAYQRKIELAD